MATRARQGLSRWLWRRHGLTWQLSSGLHARVESPSDWVVYNEIFVDAAYDAAIERALAGAAPDRPMRVLDLGAHVGYFSLRVADRVRRRPGARVAIVMVEAHPDTFEALAARWRVQPLDDRTRVRLVRGVAGARGAGARVIGEAFTAASHVAAGDEPGGVGAAGVDLDALWPDAGAIDLLKCDIEGAEAQVIAAYPGLLRRVRHAAIELHPRRVDVEGLVSALGGLGLRQTDVVTDTPEGTLRLFSR
jgi:FkbM family methyltransferase